MKKIPLILIVCALRGTLFLGVGLLLAPRCASAAGVFDITGSLNTARDLHTATLLPNGMVLVATGEEIAASGFFTVLASAELYDSKVGRWSTTGSLKTARFQHTATLLPNGMVLVVGGEDSSQNSIASAELYDPATGTWSATDSLATARAFHTATLLPNGLVLVAGGFDGNGNTASAELYDPASGTWSATGSLNTARDFHTATLLLNGMVLVAAGFDNSLNAILSAELFDPASGTWITAGDLNIARAGHTATLLADGTVLVAGGSASNTSTVFASAELYDPALGTWNATGSLVNARYLHSATLLPNDTVLLAGGNGGAASLASAELYDPGPPVITSPLTSSATSGLTFSYQFEATGATSLDVSSLPAGLTFDPALRAIVGPPETTGTFDVMLSATNGSGTTNTTLTLTIRPFPAGGPVIMSPTSATGRTGSPFKFQVITSGGSPATQLTVTGLPPGLSADPMTGEITGTVKTDGTYLVTLSVTDAGITNAATLELTFTSDLARPVITSTNGAPLFPGLPFLYTIEAPSSDTIDPVTFAEVGPLPQGLGLDTTSGIISGTPIFALGSQPSPQLAGGVVTNVQIFACNSNGCSAQGLFFFFPSGAVNISTRLSVGIDENVLIGGFITQGNAPMKLVVRGIGPSLLVYGVLLADPFLEVHSGPATIARNDNWKDNLMGGSQEVAIENTGIAPTNPLESAILAVLDPGAYTAILRGTNNGTGVGLVEVYNLGAASLDLSSEAHLANISTRGFIQTGDNVMIGGFINEGSVPMQVLVRGIGPSLLGVNGALANPVLELHKPDGTVVINDDWGTDPSEKAAIMATTIAPTDPLESAILLTLPVGEGAYSAIIHGANNGVGVGLVEAYFGNPCLGTSCP